jgi:hypothetical protein
MPECPICCDDFDVEVKCPSCKEGSCQECFHRYLLESALMPNCMTCDLKITIDFIIQNSNPEWFQDTYIPYRSNILMHIEKNKFQDTADCVTAYLQALEILGIIYDKTLDNDYTHNVISNANQCINVYGKGWEGFDFHENVARPISSYKKRTIPCPMASCLGFIVDLLCEICGCEICNDCHERVKKDHKCNLDTIKSLKIIYMDSRPCPKCNVMINKIEGCDQMFCTRCHATYSWNTGQLIRSVIENPHYYRWLYDNPRPIPRRLVNHDCNEYISYEHLISCFKKEHHNETIGINKKLPVVYDFFAELPSIPHYTIAFKNFHSKILTVRATSGNHANIQPVDNHDLRVQIMIKYIDQTTMKQELIKRDLSYHRHIAYMYVYTMVFQTSAILFDNLYAYTHRQAIVKKKPMEFMYEIYYQIQALLKYANEKLEYYNRIYGEDARFVYFDRHPYRKIA